MKPAWLRLWGTPLILFFSLASCAAEREQHGLSSRVVGGEFSYTVLTGDSLASVGSRFGVEAGVLAKLNGLGPKARLKPGQILRVDNRHIVPQPVRDGILINIPQRMLFYFSQGSLQGHYPVGLGRPGWPTPTGSFKVAVKEENPVWNVPKSIQEEMRREGKVVKSRVPPCPENPLGRYWIGLSIPAYGIHGTIAPTSVYRFVTHGCIRLHPDDIAELFPRVSVGAPGKIIYEPVLLARVEEETFYLEVHRDVYRKAGNLLKTVRDLAAAHGIGPLLDWGRVEQVVREKEGLAREVSKRSTTR